MSCQSIFHVQSCREFASNQLGDLISHLLILTDRPFHRSPLHPPSLIHRGAGSPTLLIVGSAPHQRVNINVTIVDFWIFDMSNLVGHTNSYVDPDGTPPHPPEVNDDEQLPRPSGASVPAADAASRRHEHPRLVKRPLGVSRLTSASNAPPARRRSDKRQKTAEAREDLCCFCLPAALCSSRNCSCAKAGRPCQCCDPGKCG
jgi:hypothetical protein